MSARIVSSFSIEHPQGEPSKVTLAIDRGLKSGNLDMVEVSEDQLLRLVADGARALMILRGLQP